MSEFSDDEIAGEAYRLWQEEGCPWGDGREEDRWLRAIEALRRQRSAARDFGNALTAGDLPR